MGADVKGCLFTGLSDGDFQFLGHLFNYFFNTARMNPSIADKLQKRQPGNLTPYWIKTRQNDGLGSIVNNDIYAGGRLDRPDIPAFASYYSALHFIIGQGHHGDGLVCDIVAGVSGNRQGKDVLSFPVSLHLHLVFNLGQLLTGIHPRFAFQGFHEHSFGILLAYPGNARHLKPLFADQLFDFLQLLLDSEFLLLKVFFDLQLFEVFSVVIIPFPLQLVSFFIQLPGFIL